MDDPTATRTERYKKATARGRRIRAILRRELRAGPQRAADLLPSLRAENASLSEVAFQLERLAEEGEASGEPGGPYSLR